MLYLEFTHDVHCRLFHVGRSNHVVVRQEVVGDGLKRILPSKGIK